VDDLRHKPPDYVSCELFHLSCLGLVAGDDKKHGVLPVGGFQKCNATPESRTSATGSFSFARWRHVHLQYRLIGLFLKLRVVVKRLNVRTFTRLNARIPN